MELIELDDFSRDTQRLGYVDQHVRAFSGRSTVGRVAGTVTGLERFFCPPFTAAEMAMTMDLEIASHGITIGDQARVGHAIPYQLLLQEERWHPSYICRKGTFHRYTESGLISLAIDTWLIPSAIDDSLLLKFRIQNRGPMPLSIRLVPNWIRLRFGDSLPEQWSWDPPSASGEVIEISPGSYESAGARMIVGWAGTGEINPTSVLEISPAEPREAVFYLSFARGSKPPAEPKADTVEATLKERDRDWKAFWDRAPHLEAADKQLESAYNHSLLTFFLCRWTSPHFANNPHYAEAGINGGALSNYLWGEAYASKLQALIEDGMWKPTLLTHMGMGIDEHYAFEPLTGSGVGPFYSYNAVSLAQAVEDYIVWTGDATFLNESAGGIPVWQRLVSLIRDFEARLPQKDDLLDFGDNHHLLEMRSSGFEHFVPTPNGERIRMYRFLTKILDGKAPEEAHEYRQRAASLQQVIQRELWDEESGWFRCRYPDGASELTFSIQIFDLLGREILTPEQERRVISRVNPQEFLSSWGVHSVSKQDEYHFDLGDVDWSGAGAFVGDPCNLLETLFLADQSSLAYDTLKRILWWSDKFPYWPQCIWAGKQDYSRWEQPNNRTALAFAQAIVFGMFGLTLQNGLPSFEPHIPPEAGKMTLSNVRVLGRTLQYTHDPTEHQCQNPSNRLTCCEREL